MRILIISNDFKTIYTGITASYLRAFKKLGINIDHFPYSLVGNRIIKKLYLKNKSFAKIYNKNVTGKLYDQIKLNNYEVVFVIKGTYLIPDVLKNIKNKFTNLKLLCFNPDDPFNKSLGSSNSYIKNSIKYYDHYFIWKKTLIDHILAAGAKYAHYLPFAADTDIIYPSKDLNIVQDIDVSFIGNADSERISFFRALEQEMIKRKSEIKINLFGNGWQNSKHLIANGPIEGEKLLYTIYRSKINLNILREQNKNSTNMRTFEIPAAGGFMLHEYSEEAIDFFKPGIEADYYKNVEDCVEKINYYLKNKILIQNISQAGYGKIYLLRSSYAERVKSILNALNI